MGFGRVGATYVRYNALSSAALLPYDSCANDLDSDNKYAVGYPTVLGAALEVTTATTVDVN
eukprot:729106-Prorocentrum_minimum.AAC.3